MSSAAVIILTMPALVWQSDLNHGRSLEESKYKQAQVEELRFVRRIIGILDSVQDKNSADQAVTKIRELLPLLLRLRSTIAKAGAVAADERAVLDRLLGNEFRSVQKSFIAAHERLIRIDGGLAVRNELYLLLSTEAQGVEGKSQR